MLTILFFWIISSVIVLGSHMAAAKRNSDEDTQFHCSLLAGLTITIIAAILF